ncbi:MAG TPA: hypothetical protein VJT75_09480, partial [Thermoleophilaceae bacterium]|nr:hypothetical protein [Thermoleophilaceae bacterium]
WAPAPPAPPPARPEKWDSTQNSALYAWCVANGVDTRPQYLWPLLHAAHSARALEVPAISALEFGVAGGNGLLALERAAEAATELSGTRIEIFGFDTGTGMPRPTDPRDAPWLVEESLFAMDEAALRARLTTAQLVLGDVRETVPGWVGSDHPPIGFVSFDLDYYSATVEALRVLDADAETLLPRVPCYFDDLFGYGWSEFVGEREAIDEFNRDHAERKVAKIHGLRFELPPHEFQLSWHEKLYVAHVFDHPRYAQLETPLDEGWLEAHRLSPG